MEEFSIIANLTLTNKEVVIYSSDRGTVLKTIILNAPTQTEVVLTFDGVAFPFSVGKEATVISTPIFTKEIKASGVGANLHITGLQL